MAMVFRFCTVHYLLHNFESLNDFNYTCEAFSKGVQEKRFHIKILIYYNLMASEIVHTKRIVKIAIWIIRKGVQDPITNRSPMILYYYNLQD